MKKIFYLFVLLLFAASRRAQESYCGDTLRSAAVVIMDEMEIERRLLRRGVSVYCSYRFTTLHQTKHFMRVAVSSPADETLLEKGCSLIRDFLLENRRDTDSTQG